MPAISVLVPVYNVEKTLDRCMQSIFRQTFQDFEVILVDDGSTDNSGTLCDEYEKQYENVRVIHKENEGLGPTRNRGIREALGEFIYHCDSDDWLKEDLLEKAYHSITDANADVCIFGYDIFTEQNDKIIPYDSIRIGNGNYTTKETVRELFTRQYFNAFVVMSACNRIYRRSFLLDNDIFFPPLRRCQDMAYSLLLFDKLEKLVTIEESFYCYIIEPSVYKGRSYEEMLETYMTVYHLTSQCFARWSLLDKAIERRLVNQTCEYIANYSAHAFSVKYRDNRKALVKLLLKNEEILAMFKRYHNSKKSKFMLLFTLALRLHASWALFAVSELVQRKIRHSNEKTSNP